MNNPTPPADDMAELRQQILNDILIHEEECNSSLYDENCDCIQQNVANNIMALISSARAEWEREARDATHKIYKRELDYYKNLSQQFIKREELKLEPRPIIIEANPKSQIFIDI